jgi:hypothetical protein
MFKAHAISPSERRANRSCRARTNPRLHSTLTIEGINEGATFSNTTRHLSLILAGQARLCSGSRMLGPKRRHHGSENTGSAVFCSQSSAAQRYARLCVSGWSAISSNNVTEHLRKMQCSVASKMEERRSRNLPS